VTTESSDPGASSLIGLITDIKASGVPAIFVENMSNPKVMQQIAQEAGVAIAPPLYTDAMGDATSEGATYIEMMRYNVRTIVTALTGTK
jgi:zinc/manganese transport system substrate-binding protein